MTHPSIYTKQVVDGPVNWRASQFVTEWAPDTMNDRRRDRRKGLQVSERESMPYDVVIVGAGPAGLSAAIRLKQLANEAGRELSVCILEKGSEVGAHILSGAVIDPKALDELIPDWRDQGCPLAEVPVTENQHWVLTKTKQIWLAALPHAALHAQQGHLHGQPRQSLPLARRAGRGAGRRDFPRLSPPPKFCSTKTAR